MLDIQCQQYYYCKTGLPCRHTDMKEFMNPPQLDPVTQRAQQRIAAELSAIDFALPGSIVKRMMRCGKQHCRCKDDPPRLHGPYLQWTRKSNGKTVTKMLTVQQLDRYQDWLNNAGRLRRLVNELETLTIQTVKQTEGWGS